MVESAFALKIAQNEMARMRCLSLNPLLVVFEGFAREETCLSLISAARFGMDLDAGPEGVIAGLPSATLGYPSEAVQTWLRDRLCAVLGWDAAAVEPLFVQCHQTNQQDMPHLDAIGADGFQSAYRCKMGQRALTAHLALNEEYEGGVIRFGELGEDVTLRGGDLVLWSNTCPGSAKPDPRALHAILPVTAGQRWSALMWFCAAAEADAARVGSASEGRRVEGGLVDWSR